MIIKFDLFNIDNAVDLLWTILCAIFKDILYRFIHLLLFLKTSWFLLEASRIWTTIKNNSWDFVWIQVVEVFIQRGTVWICGTMARYGTMFDYSLWVFGIVLGMGYIYVMTWFGDNCRSLLITTFILLWAGCHDYWFLFRCNIFLK